ncbi:gamma-aminobutyric acid type B receptor subunit 2-like [Elysia marginata]|uniref:Gamma-aminobutyric acid type B receptor subunit 2-like n=1 Tax=Elysia marginata TaxID=1093978 RepID=A0AAV4HV77_9GAST|nr:gamma-aminobutyric acid type B receptor subunit 2-like [Elysia marginata]
MTFILRFVLVYWVGATLVYKGVLLFFGLFLAWETREIRVDALNDSRHIGLCVYNVAVMCTVAVPLGFILGKDNLDGGYVIKSLFVILCTTVTQCIVFLPKKDLRIRELEHTLNGSGCTGISVATTENSRTAVVGHALGGQSSEL